jgi:hypothetical protein
LLSFFKAKVTREEKFGESWWLRKRQQKFENKDSLFMNLFQKIGLSYTIGLTFPFLNCAGIDILLISYDNGVEPIFTIFILYIEQD